ncbi:hypothetical protein MSSAC_1034 [Methanosarcina siciliae C2J]|uniref:Right handed beta helix domain-containing protein n=2 Tax=Methanosarcina siciliae TaxID=38027 RepID=A0A0E3PKN3_9EURY|nr:hypothetical protein MSSAC_1034 [Methanosarcina siciliae C2J]
MGDFAGHTGRYERGGDTPQKTSEQSKNDRGGRKTVTITVARDGTGDYNCDGSNDHVEINQALAWAAANPGNTVHLKGPATYYIGDSIIIGSDTTLSGDSDAVVKVHTDTQWPKDKALIKQNSPSEATKGYIKIHGFEIDGQADTLISLYGLERGKSYYTMIWLFYDDIELYDMYLHDGLNDCLKVQYSESVSVYDNIVVKPGHEFVFPIACENLEMYDNNIRCKTNSACRPWNTNHIRIHNNEIWMVHESDGGGPGLQLQFGKRSDDWGYIMDDIEIYENVFHNTYGPGIALVAFLNQDPSIGSENWGTSYAKTEACNVWIHNNIFYDCGSRTTINDQGGIVITGFDNVLIENNVFDGCYNAGVFVYNPLVGVSSSSAYKTYGSGYEIHTKNNIFANTRLREYNSSGTGQGLSNSLPSTHTLTSEYNCFYNNAGGNYKNVSSSATDITGDPRFYDQPNRDYHLKSLYGRWNGSLWDTDSVHSPCIDAGDPSSDYSNEPAIGNGGRINIGRYGNTDEASMSSEGTTTGGVIYVGFGTEDYVCDGTEDNEQIQAALDAVKNSAAHNTVYLNSGTYEITQSLHLHSGIKLTGDSGACLKLVDSAGWSRDTPIIGQSTSSIYNVEISGFEIDGNAANQSEEIFSLYYDLIFLNYADNVLIHDMNLHDNLNDAVKIQNGSNAQVYDNWIEETGDNGINFNKCSYVEAYSNHITTKTFTGIRISDSNHVELYENIIEGYEGCGDVAGIAVVHSYTVVMDDIEIRENYIIDTDGAGILAIKGATSDEALTAACNLHIHHNIIAGCGNRDDINYTGGIATKGWNDVLIENNVIDSCFRYGIAAITMTGYEAASGTGYVIEVRNNIITNIHAGGVDPSGTGVAVANTLTSTHTINCHHNDTYNSAASNYVDVTPSNDIHADPLFYQPTAYDDYHLRSKAGRWDIVTWVRDDVHSPCIDAGDPASDYSNELEGNGGRINIGRYGNTAEASLSSSAPIQEEYYTVARESGYDFYCDGADDHIQINLALIQASNSTSTKTVLLKPGLYTISDTIDVPTGITLAGEEGAIVQLAAGLSWEANQALVQVEYTAADVRISGFVLDGNRGSYPGIESGQYYHNLIMASNCTGIEIDNMTLRNNHNDAVNLNACTEVRYHDNVVDRCGHDGLYCTGCSDIKTYNNVIQCRTNSGIRLYNSDNAEIYNNEIYAAGEGGAGIQLQQYGTGVMTDIVVRNNLIRTTKGPGIWLYGGAASAVSNTYAQIYDNILYDDGTGGAGQFNSGILAWGWNADIEYNILDGCYGAGIQCNHVAEYTDSEGTGYEINVDKCIISNSRDPFSFSVRHYLSDDHDVSVSNCCLYNCDGGMVGNITASGNVTTDPLYKSRSTRDYTLLYGSPMYTTFAGHTVGLLSTPAQGSEPIEDEDEPTPDSVGTEVIDGRSVIYAEYVPESTLGTTPGAPVFRSFPGDLTKIVISSGAEFDEFEVLRPSSDVDRLNCGVAVKTVEKMHQVKVYCKPSSLGLLGYAICAANTASYTAPGTSVWPCTIGVRVGSKYTTIKGCVLQSAKYEFKDMKKTADLVLTFYGVSRTDWSTTDYAASGSHSTAPTAAPYTMSNLSNMQYDSGGPEEKGIIIDSLIFGFENTIDPILSTSGLVDSKIVGWKYRAASIPLKLGVSLTDTTIQDSVTAGNAHTVAFTLGGKTFTFSGIKWTNGVDLDAEAGAGIGLELEAAGKSVRAVFA